MNNTAATMQTEESKTYKAQLLTPIDIAIPVAGVQDHGLSLVHEMGGKPRNYLHEVSVERDNKDAIGYLECAEYSQRCGWVRPDDKKLMWTYCKPYPLTVAAWTE